MAVRRPVARMLALALALSLCAVPAIAQPRDGGHAGTGHAPAQHSLRSPVT